MGVCRYCFFFFFKQKTAYELRISDWSSDVCSSDLSVTLLNEVTSPVLNAITSGSDADGFVGPLDGNQFMILIASAIGMAAFIKQAGTIAAEFAGFTGSMGNVGGAGGAAVGGAVVAGGGAIGLVGGRMGMKAGQAVGGKL